MRARHAILSFAAVLAAALTAPKGHATAIPGVVERHIRYSITVQNTGSDLLRDAEVTLSGPVRETGAQSTVALQATQPYELETDDLGNQKLRLRITLPPYATKVVAIDATLHFATKATRQSLASSQRFLHADPLIQVDDAAIRAAALRLGGDSPNEIASALFRFVADRVHGAEYVAESRGALYALETGKGDCTESMNLLIALARARGIPARGVEGFVISHDTVVRASNFHNWAELYLEGAWRIADPNKGEFDTTPLNYAAMRILDGDQNGTVGRPLGAVFPNLEVRMN